MSLGPLTFIGAHSQSTHPFSSGVAVTYRFSVAL
jgi:hypothetical protein